MHHPEICLITQIIEDYFLLVDDSDPKYELIPITQKIDDIIYSIGVTIKRKLLNGYVNIEIKGQKQDDNAVTFLYSLSENNDKYLESIELDGCGDFVDKIRNAVRRILILDKEQSKCQKDSIESKHY
jgi:hypothetical protein